MRYSLNHFVNDEHCIITYWYDSTDVIIPADSPYSHKGTARHMLLPPAWNTVTEHCPRCTDDWGRAKDGLRPCLSSWCHTSKQTGNHKPLPRMTEEEIIFEEFEDDLHEHIQNVIDNNGRANSWSHPSNLPSSFNASRAKDNIDNPPTIGEDMNGAREEEQETHPMWWLGETTSPQDNNNKEEQ